MSATALETTTVGHPVERAARPAVRRTWSLRTSFLVVAATQTLLLAASNFPTPLFPMYATWPRVGCQARVPFPPPTLLRTAGRPPTVPQGVVGTASS